MEVSWVFAVFSELELSLLSPVIAVVAQWRAVASVSGAHLSMLQVSDQITLQYVECYVEYVKLCGIWNLHNPQFKST